MTMAAGLDLSLTSTGLVVLDTETVWFASQVITSNFRGIERARDIAVRAVQSGGSPALWVIEGYAYGAANMAKHMELAELGGVVKAVLWERGQKYIVVPPARVKKFATGKGNSQKDEMRLAVFKRWGFEAKTNDEVDAYVLARIGLAVLGYDEGLTVAQREVVAEIRKATKAA